MGGAALAWRRRGTADELRVLVLRNWCHRTGKRYQEVAAPLYRLRSALSRLWQTAPPPGYLSRLTTS